MKKFRSIIVKFLNNFSGAFVFGTSVSVVVFYFFYFILILFMDGERDLTPVIAMITVHIITLVFVFIMKINENFHKYDPELIGDNFVGFNKKCRMFKKNLELLFSHRVNYALNGFKAMEEEYDKNMDNGEKSVLNFYIARCYDLMGFYPNAARYYQSSKNFGFRNRVIDFLSARCAGSMGDIENALIMYNDIMYDESTPICHYVRTDIGKMYIKHDDAENALKWYTEAMEKHENYADAAAGAAIANLMLHNFEEADRLYRTALLNRVKDIIGFTEYYKEIKNAVCMNKDKEG
ncbi:MAG TPA: hypothetical protein DCG30_02015 [Ruminococcus sp.]|nr:hypothetical protein [Ruminococcus sp.]